MSKNKLQRCKQEVKYLSHNLLQHGRTVVHSRKDVVLTAPKPQTKKQIMSLTLNRLLQNMDPKVH